MRRLSLAAILLAAPFATPLAAQPLYVNGLLPIEPDGEARAPADAGLAEACRGQARARLGGTPRFAPPLHTTRAGHTVARLDIAMPEQPSDPTRLVRVACVRDPVSGAVEATVYDVARDGAGPRIVLLPGPDPAFRPVAAPAAAAPVVVVPGYDPSLYERRRYDPGLFLDRRCVGCPPAFAPLPPSPPATIGSGRLMRPRTGGRTFGR